MKEEEKRKIYKIVLVGDGSEARSGLRKYLGHEGKNMAKSSGVRHFVKQLEIDEEEVVMQIWEFMGQIRFDSIREIYYENSTGLILVLDISKPSTLESIPNWITEQVENSKDTIIPMILLGISQTSREEIQDALPLADLEEYAKHLSEWSGFDVRYFEVSTGSLENVDEAFIWLAREVMRFTSKSKNRQNGDNDENTEGSASANRLNLI